MCVSDYQFGTTDVQPYATELSPDKRCARVAQTTGSDSRYRTVRFVVCVSYWLGIISLEPTTNNRLVKETAQTIGYESDLYVIVLYLSILCQSVSGGCFVCGNGDVTLWTDPEGGLTESERSG